MRISLEWISEHVDLAGIAPDEVADLLTTSCAEVEELVRVEHPWERVEAAEVVATHAGKLRLRSSNAEAVVGDGGASARVGQWVLYAPPESAAARGSPEGLVCRPSDLGFDVPGEQILLLPSERSCREIAEMPRSDWMLTIDNKSLTHRPDLWGHYGFARELAAIFRRELAPLRATAAALADRDDLPEHPVRVEAPGDCPSYGAMLVALPASAPSPLRLQARLLAAGLRPICLAVDASNYVMLELGQPTHAFDGDRVGDIVVGSVDRAESFLGLDGVERRLEPGDLVIRSGARSVALAGIVGSREAEVGELTDRVLLESACFRAARIRATSRRLGLRTEASQRYEKGQPTGNARLGARRYLALLEEHGVPVKALSCLTLRGAEPPAPRIRVPLDLLCGKVGAAIALSEAEDILRRLRFTVASEGEVLVTDTPPHRSVGDISIPEDIIEEVARIRGYSSIDPVLPLVPAAAPKRDLSACRDRACRLALSAFRGFTEVHTYAWYDSAWLRRLGYAPSGCVALRNPPADGLELLRTELLPNLLVAADGNARRREAFVLYEVGRVFGSERGRTRERSHLGIVSVRSKRSLSAQEQLLELKGALADALRAMGTADARYRPTRERTKPWEGACGEILCRGSVCGRIGSAPDAVSAMVGPATRVAWLELDLDALCPGAREAPRYQTLPTFPSSWQDFSLLWPEERSYADLEGELSGFRDQRALRREMRGSYRGTGMPAGFVCHTIRFHLGSPERTLDSRDLTQFQEEFARFVTQRGIRLREGRAAETGSRER